MINPKDIDGIFVSIASVNGDAITFNTHEPVAALTFLEMNDHEGSSLFLHLRVNDDGIYTLLKELVKNS